MLAAESAINHTATALLLACVVLLAIRIPRRPGRTRSRATVSATGSLLRLALSSLGLGLIATPAVAARSRMVSVAAKSPWTTPPWLRTDASPPPRASVPTEAEPRAHPAIHAHQSPRSEPAPLFPRTKHRASHVVTPGDTLWSIAARHLATDDAARIARYWPTIHRANRAVVGANPNSIFPGQVLTLPPEHGNRA